MFLFAELLNLEKLSTMCIMGYNFTLFFFLDSESYTVSGKKKKTKNGLNSSDEGKVLTEI